MASFVQLKQTKIEILNKKLKRQPRTIPNISEMVFKLEGFKYAKSLNLNMVYYHIQHS